MNAEKKKTKYEERRKNCSERRPTTETGYPHHARRTERWMDGIRREMEVCALLSVLLAAVRGTITDGVGLSPT